GQPAAGDVSGARPGRRTRAAAGPSGPAGRTARAAGRADRRAVGAPEGDATGEATGDGADAGGGEGGVGVRGSEVASGADGAEMDEVDRAAADWDMAEEPPSCREAGSPEEAESS